MDELGIRHGVRIEATDEGRIVQRHAVGSAPALKPTRGECRTWLISTPALSGDERAPTEVNDAVVAVVQDQIEVWECSCATASMTRAITAASLKTGTWTSTGRVEQRR